MQRITISVDDDLLGEFDAYMTRKGYGNRSEAFRDLLRARIDGERLDEDPTGQCIGCLTYVFNHSARELSGRLTHAQHDHHDLAVSTLHVHLDHDDCMEVVVLRGETRRVRDFANAVMAQPGVRHGHLHMVPAQVRIDRHSHGHDHRHGASTPHIHSHPRT